MKREVVSSSLDSRMYEVSETGISTAFPSSCDSWACARVAQHWNNLARVVMRKPELAKNVQMDYGGVLVVRPERKPNSSCHRHAEHAGKRVSQTLMHG